MNAAEREELDWLAFLYVAGELAPDDPAAVDALSAAAREGATVLKGYAIDALGKLGALVLVPLYTHVLGPADFGALELFLVTQALLVIVLAAAATQVHPQRLWDRVG